MAGGGTNGGGQAAGNPPAAASSAASAGGGGPPAMNAPGMPMPAGMMAPEGMFGIPPAGQAPMPAGQYRPPTATTSHAQQSHAQQGAQVLDAQLTTFWTEQQTEVEQATDFKNHLLPLARIKKIMKSDEDVRMISAEAPVLFAKACEMFILELTLRAWAQTEEAKRRTLQRSDISAAIQKTDIFDFLIDIVPRDEPKKEVGAPVAGFPGAVPGGVMPPGGTPVGGYYGMPNAGMPPYMSQGDPAAAAMMYQQHQQQQQLMQQQQQQHQQQPPGQQPGQQQMYYGAATSTAGGAGNMYGGANPAMAGNANLQQFMRLQQQQQQQQQQMFLQQQQQQQPYQNFNGHYGNLMPEGQQGQPGAPPAQQPPQQ